MVGMEPSLTAADLVRAREKLGQPSIPQRIALPAEWDDATVQAAADYFGMTVVEPIQVDPSD